ncbi:MAG: chain length-determining protein [Paucibacter sp.]|nr:chain length-determining protein [Roseateles sp.]
MDLIIYQLLLTVRQMWRFRWSALLVAWVVGLVAGVVVFLLPNRYEASARIYVDTQSILKPLMSGLAVQPNVEQQVNMLSRTLISRPNVEKLVHMADLDLKDKTKSDQDARVEDLMKALSIRSTNRDNLYTLSYRDADPETAKRVVQALVSIFVESSLGASRKDTVSATNFINDQIKSYEAKLEEAESRLKEFRLKNIQMQFGEGKDAAGRVTELSTQLEQARLEYREAVNARDAARQQMDIANQNSKAAVIATASTPELDARLDTQRRNLDILLQRFTDQHPDVIAARKSIAEMEEQKRRQLVEIQQKAAAGAAVPNSNNLVNQELSRVLATAEVQVASLRARVDEYSRRYAEAVAALKTAPQIEAEAAQLNRDYAINKKNYEDLVARRESAAMSGELDVASGVADFRVIDPPRSDSAPVAPNRLVFLGAAFLLSLGSGVAAAFIGSQLRPVFFDMESLRTSTDLPILGQVSYMETDEDRRLVRRDSIRFGAGVLALTGLYGLGFVVVAFLFQQAVNS